jgi:hypothetical protein
MRTPRGGSYEAANVVPTPDPVGVHSGRELRMSGARNATFPARANIAAAVSAIFEFHGARIGLRARSREHLTLVESCLPPGSRPSTGPADVWYELALQHGERLRLTDEAPAGGREVDGILAALDSRIHFDIAVHSRNAVFVHAGVVEWAGRALVFPGPSWAGKSTLVEALLGAGATYFSDEYAVVDEAGWVHPYAKRLSLRDECSSLTRRASAEDLGGQTGVAACPVGMVALVRHQTGAQFNTRRVSPGEALLGLLANTVTVRARPDLALTHLAPAAVAARAVCGVRGEASAAAARLLAMME